MSAQLDIPHSPSAKNHALRALARVLFTFCDRGEIGILELARHVNVSVGMAQRITEALVEAELLSQSEETRKYSLGNAVLRLSNAYLRNAGPELQRCIAQLPGLTQKTGETASVHRRIGQRRMIVAQVEGGHDLSWRSDTSRTYPLHAGAASKALLAAMGPDELDRLLETLDFRRFQPATPGDRQELELELAQVRRSGVAISFGERAAGAGGVAAAVPGTNGGESGYAISVYGPEVRIRPALPILVQEVREAADRAAYGGQIKEKAGNDNE